jgi:glycosyltransferase involved in cell wall biosynthesis
MRIGVVVAARDAEAWIADAVVSVRAQIHRDWILAVVDDGSRDQSATRALEAADGDPRVRLIRQIGAGVSAARNRGAAAVGDTDALLFLDADDWLAPHALTRLAACLRAAPQAIAASGSCAFVPAEAKPGAWPLRLLHPPSGDLLERGLLQRNLFANCGQVLLRAEAVRRAGLFRDDLAYGEDWEFLVRLAALGPFARLDAGEMPVLFVRRRPAGAFLAQAARIDASGACMAAIFDNEGIKARLGAARLVTLRRQAETETIWTAGRALLAQRRRPQGLLMLARGLARRPSARRAAVALAACCGAV